MNVRQSIYVVDDEVAIASTLAAILVENGYSAKCFTSPFEALELARSEPPQVLFSTRNAVSSCFRRSIYPSSKLKSTGFPCPGSLSFVNRWLFVLFSTRFERYCRKASLSSGIHFFTDHGSQRQAQWCCDEAHTVSTPAVLREHECTSWPLHYCAWGLPGVSIFPAWGSSATGGFTSG
jgi:hypothetical protein